MVRPILVNFLELMGECLIVPKQQYLESGSHLDTVILRSSYQFSVSQSKPETIVYYIKEQLETQLEKKKNKGQRWFGAAAGLND